ncbi:MAG: hypothetical protein BWX86_00212 [Verrucomicrobia bacterium ADurb.Bin122]|nr:MAG: hypothetical protein BWX86_00212 [Verrucomicrobia bacterium ADurb.Bin122]
MSWHFSQALEAEFLAEHCSDGERFAPWNSLPFALDDSHSAKMKEICHRSPFGTMFVPSTDALGAELLTWFQAAFRAKTFPVPERAPESKEVARVCGPKWRGLSVKLAPNGSWLKIRLSSHQEGSEQSCETWPKWGSMRNGECWERLTPERPTSGKESGLLPTIRATDGERGGRGDLIQAVRGNENKHFKMWQTPVADDACNRVNGKFNSRGEPKLSAEVLMWATPTVCGNYNKKGASAKSGNGLATQVTLFPTPLVGGTGESCHNQITGRYRKAMAPHLPPGGGQLNPDWVEWLMGWPIGWTACEPLETARFQQWPQWHSGFSPDDC